MNFKYTSNPTAEPLTLATVKAFLKVEHTEDDTIISDLISQKREYIETFLDRTLMVRSIEMAYPSVQRIYRVPVVPIIEVQAVKYSTDDSDEVDVVDSAVNLRSRQACIIIDPSAYPDRIDDTDIVITLNTGYTDVEQIPKPIINALMLLVADAYECRHNKEISRKMTTAAADLLEPYRNQRLF